MTAYEMMFLVRQDSSAQQVEMLANDYSQIITESGGKVLDVDNWGLRSLAYRIKKNRKAHYTLMRIEAESSAVSEVERRMRLNEDVLRTLTIRVDSHDESEFSINRANREQEDTPADERQPHTAS